jgi:eukaryotic-like serine/threonine-protein kinase
MLGEVIANRYELVELVGTGGMSSVYKAHDGLLERNVALKILHPHYGEDDEYVERFRREARMVAQMSHPNIVTVIDRGEDDGQQYIVFELVDGENLKQLVERTGPLPVRRVGELGVAIADALAFAHEHGLVHRDVKPQNVLLTPDGEAKVTDFGIARSLDVEHGVTQTGTVLGTSNYLSPEQASGKPVTPATDVYSLGVVLYELLTAEVPFPGENFVAVAMKHVNEPVPDITEKRPDVPLRLVAAIERALEKDPASRFDSMDQFKWELRQCLEELAPVDAERTFIQPSPVLRESRPHRVQARRRRRWPLYLVLAAAAAAAIVAGVLTLGGSNEKGPTAAPAGANVPLTGVGAYDPDGGDGEHDADAPKATDHDLTTYWNTEHYNTFTKRGVGVVLDAGRRVKLASVVVSSATPGFTAAITSGSSPNGPFVTDSGSQTVTGTTTFSLQGATARYYVVWITNLGPNSSVEINEVRARS